jgi:hypothetical protein
VSPDTLDIPSEPPTVRDLTALAWSLDLDEDIDEQPEPSTDGGRRS